jgi:hypothetical protein
MFIITFVSLHVFHFPLVALHVFVVPLVSMNVTQCSGSCTINRSPHNTCIQFKFQLIKTSVLFYHREWILSLASEPYWHQSKVPNSELSCVRKSTESWKFSWGVIVKESCHPRNSTLRPFFRKTSTAIVFRRSENLRIRNFAATGLITRPNAPSPVPHAPPTRRSSLHTLPRACQGGRRPRHVPRVIITILPPNFQKLRFSP